jgi:hypothetical protein
MRLGETIATYDVGLALRGKSGKFKVTGPGGEIYEVICKSNHADSTLEWSKNGTEEAPFMIRKVAEGTHLAESPADSDGTTVKGCESVSSPLPFVLEQGRGAEDSAISRSIELFYVEEDPDLGRPSACVYLNEPEQDEPAYAGIFMTSRCVTFNEFDCEIRKLEAQLNEIRSRAKKMFYKSHEVVLSA